MSKPVGKPEIISPATRKKIKDDWFKSLPRGDSKLPKDLELEAQNDYCYKEMLKEEYKFLDSILHLPFFEFCLQVKERKQALQSQLVQDS